MSLASGTADLKNGTAQLKNGSSELSDGILQLKNSLPALTDGVSQLKDGGLQLSDGIKKFNEDGIQKITELVGGDLDTLVSRLKATSELSKKYRNFSGIGDDMDGKVRFIYRTEEIK